MTAKEIVRTLMSDKGKTNAEMAGALNISQATLWDRLNPSKSDNMTVKKFNSMLRILGFELVVIPRGKAGRLDSAYVVSDTDNGKIKPSVNLDDIL